MQKLKKATITTQWSKTLLKKIATVIIIRRVQGASMLPTIPHGKLVFGSSLIAVKPKSIVIARHENTHIIKRVKKINKSLAYLAGDNKSIHHNMTVKKTDILGVII